MTDALFTRELVMRTWVKKELEHLWYELELAHGNTNRFLGQLHRDRPWSMMCDSLAERILEASALVGPIPARDIGMSRIADGWFVWACEKIGVPNPDLPTLEDVQYAREYVEAQKLQARRFNA